MSAVVEVSGDALRVVVRNDGGDAVRIPRSLLAPALAFEVVGPDARALPVGPPPVPPADLDAETATIGPGETLALAYRTNELFAGDPPDGRHRLRFAVDASLGRIESPWVDLVV